MDCPYKEELARGEIVCDNEGKSGKQCPTHIFNQCQEEANKDAVNALILGSDLLNDFKHTEIGLDRSMLPELPDKETALISLLLLIFKKNEAIACKQADVTSALCWGTAKDYVIRALSGDRVGLEQTLIELGSKCAED